MISPRELARFAEVCARLGDASVDGDGFVPLRHLLARFDADVIVRPLLVEGMLATVDRDGGSGAPARWAVLLDEETYPVGPEAFAIETARRPLNDRLRNTVAHELAHSLAFRSSEFGIRLGIEAGEGGGRAKLVAEIEKATERLSPLLLWPEATIATLVAGKTTQVSIDELSGARRAAGISRYVLINRLCLLPTSDERGLRYSKGLMNLAVGLAEWTSTGDAMLLNWPLFANFDRNVLPDFVRRLAIQKEDRVRVRDVVANRDFAMCGGRDAVATFVIELGVGKGLQRWTVEWAFEAGARSPGARFMYALKRVSVEYA